MNLDIRAEILKLAIENKQVVYGQQATNFFLPDHLKKQTKDYDILTKKPELSAKQLVINLNKKYGDRFEAIPARYSKTFKVKDKTTGETIADYTKATKKPNSYNDLGVRYANLSYSENKIKKILKDEASSFRHDKDLDTLNRIRSRRWL